MRPITAIFAVFLVLLAGSALGDGKISPRFDDEQSKDILRPYPAAIYTTSDSAARRIAARLNLDPPTGSVVLAKLRGGERQDLARDPAVRYIMPQTVLSAPDLEQQDNATDAPDAEPEMSTEKSLKLSPTKHVRIGVIDYGIAPRENFISSKTFGEGERQSGRASHVVRVVRIIHRLAPDAEIIVAELPSTGGAEQDVINAAHWLVSKGVRVINVSGVSFRERHDGKSTLDKAANDADAAGVLWVNAAGNAARRHWTGSFRTRGGVVEVPATSDNAWRLNVSGAVTLTAVWSDWNDSGPVNRHGVRLRLTKPDGQVQEVERKREDADPVLQMRVTGPIFGPCRLQILTDRPDDAYLHIYVEGDGASLWPRSAAGSIGVPATAPGAFAVGAVETSGLKVAPYSSAGPTDDMRSKPDIAARGDEGASAGTSFAAPRVTAMAARLLSENPRLTSKDLRRNLIAMGVRLPAGSIYSNPQSVLQVN